MRHRTFSARGSESSRDSSASHTVADSEESEVGGIPTVRPRGTTLSERNGDYEMVIIVGIGFTWGFLREFSRRIEED